MIETRVGDIFEQKDISFVAHQCNLFHNFGAGIAAIIRKRYPWAYEADCLTARGDRDRLGSYALATPDSWQEGKGLAGIFNVYSQEGLSAVHRMTNYAAVGKAFIDIERELRDLDENGDHTPVLGIPYNFGCGLANGHWPVVEEIIFSAFQKSKYLVVVCRLDPRK